MTGRLGVQQGSGAVEVLTEPASLKTGRNCTSGITWRPPAAAAQRTTQQLQKGSRLGGFGGKDIIFIRQDPSKNQI